MASIYSRGKKVRVDERIGWLLGFATCCHHARAMHLFLRAEQLLQASIVKGTSLSPFVAYLGLVVYERLGHSG